MDGTQNRGDREGDGRLRLHSEGGLSRHRGPGRPGICCSCKYSAFLFFSFFIDVNTFTSESVLPYLGKMKQLTKVTFHVKEQNVSVISTDIDGIS